MFIVLVAGWSHDLPFIRPRVALRSVAVVPVSDILHYHVLHRDQGNRWQLQTPSSDRALPQSGSCYLTYRRSVPLCTPEKGAQGRSSSQVESYRGGCTGFTIVSAVTVQISPLQGLRPRSQCVLSATTFTLPPVRPKQTGMPSIPFSHAGRGFPLLNRPMSRSVLPKNSTVPDLPALRTPRRAGRVFRRRAQLEASFAG